MQWFHNVKRVLYLFYVAVFALFLIAPSLQNAFRIFPNEELTGVENSAPRPHFDSASWMSGVFQSNFEAWYEKSYGLRGYFVRTDNQLNFSAFHEITDRKLIIGKCNTLYEKCYINDYLGHTLLADTYLEETAIRLRKLQDYLAKHGVSFLWLITPGKTSVYPEFIPDYYLKYANKKTSSNYSRLVHYMEKHGVNYLDSVQFLSSLKGRTRYRLFPKGGTHWSYYSSCLVTQNIIARLEQLLRKKMADFEIEKVELLERPFGSDDDLAKLANLWDISSFLESSPYPKLSVLIPADGVKPNVLLVGGSFVTGILHWLTSQHVISDESDFYFYFPQKKILDADREIFSRDAIILETNEEAVYSFGFGFIEAVFRDVAKADDSFTYSNRSAQRE